MNSQKPWAVFFLTCTINLTTYAADQLPDTVVVPGTLPSVLSQRYNDCAVNAVVSSIEYLTTPAHPQDQSPFLPVKSSRSFLYTVGLDHDFGTMEMWKKRDYSVLKSDCGVSIVSGLMMGSLYGCPPEQDIVMKDGRKIPGWPYETLGQPVPPAIFRLGLDKGFDGIPEALKSSLLEDSVVRKKDLCDEKNPYSRVREHLFYKMIERPKEFTADFYTQVTEQLRQGHPIVIGISVTKDFMDARGTSVIQGRGALAGDMHVILLLGIGTYHGQKNCFYIQNSWGSSWGDGGRGCLSQGYFKKYFYGGYAVSLPGFFEKEAALGK